MTIEREPTHPNYNPNPPYSLLEGLYSSATHPYTTHPYTTHPDTTHPCTTHPYTTHPYTTHPYTTTLILHTLILHTLSKLALPHPRRAPDPPHPSRPWGPSSRLPAPPYPDPGADCDTTPNPNMTLTPSFPNPSLGAATGLCERFHEWSCLPCAGKGLWQITGTNPIMNPK